MVTIQPYIRIIIKNHSSFTLNVFDQKYIPTITKIIASTNRAVETSNSDSIPKFKNGDFIKKELDRKIGTDIKIKSNPKLKKRFFSMIAILFPFYIPSIAVNIKKIFLSGKVQHKATPFILSIMLNRSFEKVNTLEPELFDNIPAGIIYGFGSYPGFFIRLPVNLVNES